MKKITVVFLLVHSLFLTAQQKVNLNYFVPDNERYNSYIPTPKSVIGHEVGEWHVTHDKLVQYMEALAAASDRIQIETRGHTFEGRPLLLLTITSPENHKNLEAIRNNHINATNDERVDVTNQPIVVYQGFSIHGNEPSGSNAAMAVAYYLAASLKQETQELLDNTVILFDPSFNPDGLQRFAYWANTNKSTHLNPDPNDREYSEVWPGGRTNHYWFDMNRDWLPVQLPESRARIATFHKWLPNILTDHHEMGTNSSFFFQPGIQSRTHPLTPKLNQELTKEIGGFHVEALDKIGSLYYSEESFDDFYYGKGSTFPDINGGIGILFEQASSRGHIQESENGVLTFPFTIRNQYTAAMSTLKAAKNMRVKLKSYQQDFYANARKESAKEKAIVFGDAKDAAKTYHLAEVLKRHQVKIHEIASDFSMNGKNFRKGYSYIVPMNQKNQRLVKAMFDVRTTFQDSLFYDVSAWTFNHAFGVDYAENVSLSKAGAEVKVLKMKEGAVSRSTYGYLMPWNEYYAPKALHGILAKGIRAKVSLKNFSNAGKAYDYGTIFIPAQNQDLNADELFSFLRKVADESHVEIIGVATGLNEGIDLGSNNFKNITPPKVAILVGNGMTSYDAGEIWHLFDQRFEMQITKLDMSYAGRTDLSKYTTIIVPNSYNENTAVVSNLKEWVRKGGVLIGYRNAINWLSDASFMNVDIKKSSIDSVDNVSFENRSNQSGAQVIGGAIFEAKLDRSHPVNFGIKNDKIALFRNTTLFLSPDKKSFNNPIQYTDTPLLSGYISKENLKVLEGSVPFKAQRMGRGRVLVFTDNTNFRAFWYGTNKLLMNAVFFGNHM